MKVVQINAVYAYSSTGRTTKELHEYMNGNGITSYVACSQLFGLKENSYMIGNQYGKKIHAVLSRITGLQGYFSSFSTRKLVKYLNQIKPDVVHLRNLHGNYINLKMLLNYLIKNDIATVITLHDCWFFTGKCCYYTESNCYGWLKKCGNCPALKKNNPSWFFDRTKKMLNDKEMLLSQINRLGVVGVSKWVSDDAKKSRVFKNAKIIKPIFNWIDLNLFKPCNTDDLREKLNLTDKFVILGIAQKWNSAKGIDIFIELSEILPSEYVIVLIGNIDKSHNIRNIDKSHNIRNIVSVGEIKDVTLLANYYSMADVFINPSIQETFGKTTVEALSSGTPVVAYNATATPELVGYDEKCGYIIDENKADEYFEKIKIIKEKTKSFYSENCRKRSEEKFNKEKNIREYIDLYENLIEG